MTGTAQRYWPSVPTVYFLVHADRLQPGDFIEWPHPFSRPAHGGKPDASAEAQLRVTFDSRTIELCLEAKSAIRDWTKLPDLGDMVHWPEPRCYPDTAMHLLTLH